jgi:hypothetical protein
VSSRVEQVIPSEINDHLKIFGKDADQVDYNSVEDPYMTIRQISIQVFTISVCFS